jgi:hypothetical protein
MIALLAAAVIQTSPVIEWLDPTASVVSIEAVVKLPSLTQKQFALLRVVCGTLGEETATYSGTQIADIAARTGSRLRATVMEDHIRIGMDVVPADLGTGISMVGAVLKESAIKTDSLKRVSDDLQFRRFSFWRQALDRYAFDPPRYMATDLTDLVSTVFRPENVTLAVGGKLTPGVATEKWDAVVSSWKPARPVKLDTSGASKPSGAIDGKESVIEFAGPKFLATSADFSTKLLALTGLGTGKEASLWRIVREKMALSYRQEFVLYPCVEGFQPRLLIAHSGKEDLDKKAEAIKAALLEDVKAWTEDDKRRAIGMAESYLVRGGDMSPLYFAPGRPLSRDLADQVFLQAYWSMKTRTRWNPFQLVGRLGFIELADLKEAAEEMISKAETRIYPASS